VAIAKDGNLVVATGIGGGKKKEKEGEKMETHTHTLHQANGGWFSGGEAIVQVACGREVIYGRTARGQVLYWTLQQQQTEQTGKGEERGAPSPSLKFSGPHRYPQLKKEKITHLAAGPEHAIFVTAKGDAFAVGQNEDGRLGLGLLEDNDSSNNNNNTDTPTYYQEPDPSSSTSSPQQPSYLPSTPIPLPMSLPPNAQILTAACGNTHTLLLTTTGEAYSCGFDSWYQLAQGM
jgi:alpha-tubulin suppressor-like RCC1 family protein